MCWFSGSNPEMTPPGVDVNDVNVDAPDEFVRLNSAALCCEYLVVAAVANYISRQAAGWSRPQTGTWRRGAATPPLSTSTRVEKTQSTQKVAFALSLCRKLSSCRRLCDHGR